MNYDDIESKLKQINIEYKIWIIYLGIIFLSYYSNNLERNYFINNDNKSRIKYQRTMILIFSILVIIYFYFLKSSLEDIRNLKITDSVKRKNLTYLSFIGSSLVAISGLIFLYIVLKDEDINVEIAFN